MKLLTLIFAITSLPLFAAVVVSDPFPPARFTSLYIERDEKGTATIIQMAGDTVIYKTTIGRLR